VIADAECPFCRIASGRLPARFVDETPHVVAFLDLHPIRRGHVLVVPREHFPYYDDLRPSVAAEVMRVAQRLAPALRTSFGVERVGLFFTGVDMRTHMRMWCRWSSRPTSRRGSTSPTAT
jgi:histidine triad (HIT) family protein